METYVRQDFKGSYRLFYPEQDLDDVARTVVVAVAKNVFGNVKVYFTDDKEAVLLEDKTVVPPQDSSIFPGSPIALTEQERIIMENNKARVAGAQKKTKYTDAASTVKVAKDEGRVTSW